MAEVEKSVQTLQAELHEAERNIKILTLDLEEAYTKANTLRWQIYQHPKTETGANYKVPQPNLDPKPVYGLKEQGK
jgi:DNA-directed RNA polymerase subunit L